MAITPPVPIDAGPALPSSSDSEATFDAAFEAFLSWQKTQLQPQTNALAANVYSNAVEAEASATTATAKAGEASASASAADADRIAAETARTEAQVAAAAAGAAAGLPSLAGKALQNLRVNAGASGVEWAPITVPPLELQRVGVFADGASALTPVSSGEVIFDTQVDTGLVANTNGVAFSNSLFIATGPVTGVATAASAAGPWTLRSFAASLGGGNPRIGTDGTNSMVSASGVTAVARSTNGTTWTSATALPGNTATGAVPVCIGGVWLIAATAATSVYRSNNHGTSWTTETINAPVESTIFRLGTRFCYFNGSAIYHSTLGTTADFTFFSHGLGFTPAQITPLPDGTCAFIGPVTGQVYLATDFNVLTLQTGVFCPLNHRILRINGVWVFVPINAASGPVYTASSSGMASRLAASCPNYPTLTQPAMPYAVSGGVTVLPRAFNNLGASFNGWVIVITHSTSRQVYFAGA